MNLKKNISIIKEFNFYILIFVSLLLSCASSLYKKAQNENTIQSYENFISKYPENKYVDSAKIRIEKLFYSNAVKHRKINLYKEYLSNYPNGLYIDQASDSIMTLTWESVSNINTCKAYNEFLKQYAHSNYKNKVLSAIEKIMIKKANASNEINDYEDYLLKFPQGVYSDEAREMVKKLSFDKAKKENSLEALKHYLTKFPEDTNNPTLVKIIEKLFFEQAKKGKKLGDIEQYLVKYPNGLYVNEAKQIKNNILNNEINNVLKGESIIKLKGVYKKVIGAKKIEGHDYLISSNFKIKLRGAKEVAKNNKWVPLHEYIIVIEAKTIYGQNLPSLKGEKLLISGDFEIQHNNKLQIEGKLDNKFKVKKIVIK